MVVDSGACDSIIPPSPPTHIFPNIAVVHTSETGKYRAYGGEGVRNFETNRAQFVTKDGQLDKTTFQNGDTLTRPLYAASQLCTQGNAVFFGPGPKFDNFSVKDPETLNFTQGETHTNTYEQRGI